MAKQRKSMNGKQYHVVPHENGWAVKTWGCSKSTSIYDTQKEAISSAKRVVKGENYELIIHRRDGSVRERNQIKSDPSPPSPRRVIVPSLNNKKRETEIRAAVRDVMSELKGKSNK